MILKSINGKKWMSKAIDKLKAYLNRAPIQVTYIIGTDNCQDGVFLIVSSAKKKLFFAFDYELEPKAWVHKIKEFLVQYYPRLIEDISETHKLTSEEKAILAEKGTSLNDIPNSVEVIKARNCWRIDKCLLFKEICLLYLEGAVDENGEFLPSESSDTNLKPIMRRYKYTGSLVLFLKKLREASSNKKSLVELSKEFFKNAIPLDDVDIKNN